MSTHDDPRSPGGREAAALAALDRRGRAAGAAVRSAVAVTLVADRPAGAVGGGADPALGPYAPLAVRRPRRGWMLAAAAALLAVAAVAGSVLALRGDDDPPVTSGGGPILLPGWLPDGFAPGRAIDFRTVDDVFPDGRVVAYGLTAAADPWAGPTIAVVRVDQEWIPDTDEPSVAYGSRQVWAVGDGTVPAYAWGDGGATMLITGQGVDAGVLAAAAAAATVEPAVPAGALPAGFAELARGGHSATHALPSAGYNALGDAVAVTWYSDGVARSDRGIAVTQRPGTEAEVDLARLGEPAGRAVETRGRHAVLATAPGPLVQWWEDGMLVTVAGMGVTQEDVVRVAEGLRPARPGELEDLLADHGMDVEESIAVGTGFDAATGTEAGRHWALEVSEGRDSNSVGLAWGDGSASVGWAPASGPGDLLVAGSQSEGWPGPALFGVVSERVASVTAEGPGLPATEVELHPATVGGTELKVFAVFPPGSGPVTVVARDAAGAEVVRKGV